MSTGVLSRTLLPKISSCLKEETAGRLSQSAHNSETSRQRHFQKHCVRSQVRPISTAALTPGPARTPSRVESPFVTSHRGDPSAVCYKLRILSRGGGERLNGRKFQIQKVSVRVSNCCQHNKRQTWWFKPVSLQRHWHKQKKRHVGLCYCTL